MKRSRPNPQRVKIHRNYTAEEIAMLFNIHKNTVRNWIKQGLPVIDDRRPALILGKALRHFLELKRTKRKATCKPGELYCLKCRKPQRPAEDMVEYTEIREGLGSLTAICPSCNSIMNQRVNEAKLDIFKAALAKQIT